MSHETSAPRYVDVPAQLSVDLDDVPAGLAAFPVYRWRTDDNGRPTKKMDNRIRHFHLRPEETPPTDAVATRIAALPERTRTVVLADTSATASQLRRRLNRDWEATAVDLARAGIVVLTASSAPRDGGRLGTIKGWRLTDPATDAAFAHDQANRAAHHEWQQRAIASADHLAHAPNLRCDATTIIKALRLAVSSPSTTLHRLRVLVAAAESLADGLYFGGVRAFSRRHFDDSKTADADHVLSDLNVDESVRKALGVFRSGPIHLAGRITIHNPLTGATTSTAGFPGPWALPADPAKMHLTCDSTTLVVVENEDPARHIAEVRPDLAVWWLAGYTGPIQLRMLGELAATASEVVVITDADPDGVRIAAQVLAAVPAAHIIDIGAHLATPRARDIDPQRRRTLEPILAEPAIPAAVRAFAEAVIQRTHDVEQDDVTLDAIETWLGTSTRSEPVNARHAVAGDAEVVPAADEAVQLNQQSGMAPGTA